MDDELDAWLFGDPTALLATNNPYADILSQFPENTNLDDYVVTENGLIRNTAGDTGTFKDGKWIPYTGGDVKTFLTGSSASRFLNFAKRAKDALSSPQGIAGLAGAALGFLDRPKPSGGGTTMSYPGAAKLERKMVQGPYGPLAEYTGVGGGTPDYTRFTAPQVQFPTVGSGGAPSAGAGMSMQAKIDLYKQLRGYGLSDERVRRIAETMFGVQTDSDWSELTRRAGVTTGGIAGQTQKPSTDTTSGTKPSAVVGSQTLYTDPSQQKYKPSGMASWLQTSLSPIEKAAAYNAYLSNDMTDAEIRSMAEKNFGKQPDSDWAELKRLAATLPKNLIPSGRSFTDLELKGAVKRFLDSNQKPSTKPDGSTQTIDPNKDYGINYGFTRDPNAVGGMATVPWYNKKTGQTYIASDTAWRPPNEDWAKGEFDSSGNIINPAAKKEPATSKPLVENPATFTGPPSLQVSQSSTPQQKAQEYQRLRQFGMSDSQIRAMVDAQMGKQDDSDWQYLRNLAGETAATATQEAKDYLTQTGVSGQVYDTSSGAPTVIPAAQPAAQPAALRDLKSLLPSDWGSITDPSKKIDWFNQKRATQAELTAAGVKPEEIAWMRQNKLGTYAGGGITQGYAHGGEARAYAGGKPLTMEDGGFVFTKKATDKLGRRGIAALGGKMISAPGNGTDDRGITGIIGKNGVTPARVSNGEAYIPPGRHDTKKLYALMHSLERKA